MAWRHVEKTTTTAPRNLTRATAVAKPIRSYGGFYSHVIPRAEPSVGGTAEVTHDVWRHSCGALAVTADGTAPGACGKCGEGS